MSVWLDGGLCGVSAEGGGGCCERGLGSSGGVMWWVVWLWGFVCVCLFGVWGGRGRRQGVGVRTIVMQDLWPSHTCSKPIIACIPDKLATMFLHDS